LLLAGKATATGRPLAGRRDELLTVAQVAKLLGLSKATVYSMCAAGALPHVRIVNAVRFERTAIEQFIMRHRREH
jgi:excisionase family DNA binding protein